MVTLPIHVDSCSFLFLSFSFFFSQKGPLTSLLSPPSLSASLSLLYVIFSVMRKRKKEGSHPAPGVLFMGGEGPLWEAALGDISVKLQPSTNTPLSCSGCKFLVNIHPAEKRKNKTTTRSRWQHSMETH